MAYLHLDTTNRNQGYEYYGFHVLNNNDVVYREWAPSALRAYLIGDFSKIVTDQV
jgi:1,4-alpha-glucan branching enzyme